MLPSTHADPGSRTNPWVLPALVVGFGVAVAMWCLGFVTHLPGISVPTAVTGSVLLLAHLATGYLAARSAPGRLFFAALSAGFVVGCVNLLVLGALLAPTDPSQQLPAHGAFVALGYVGASIIFAMLGAAIALATGSRASRGARVVDRERWLARFAIVAAVSAAPVILSGGLVTSADAGLAVHDWPGSYGALMWLYPLSRMTGGIYFEHAHRLFGSLVGFTMIVLVILSFVSTRRSLPRIAAIIALAAVIAQGIMGGQRVVTADAAPGQDLSSLTPESVPADAPANFALTKDNATSRGLAVAHGIFGQLTVAWLGICAVVMSPRYANARSAPPIRDTFLRRASAVLIAVLLLQLLLGATTRHLNHIHVLFTHAGFALVALVACSITGLRAAKHRGTPLRPLGMTVAHGAGLQVILGFAAMFSVLPYGRIGPEPWHAILLATAHQALGALLITSAAMLAVWSFRLTESAASDNARAAIA